MLASLANILAYQVKAHAFSINFFPFSSSSSVVYGSTSRAAICLPTIFHGHIEPADACKFLIWLHDANCRQNQLVMDEIAFFVNVFVCVGKRWMRSIFKLWLCVCVWNNKDSVHRNDQPHRRYRSRASKRCIHSKTSSLFNWMYNLRRFNGDGIPRLARELFNLGLRWQMQAYALARHPLNIHVTSTQTGNYS